MERRTLLCTLFLSVPRAEAALVRDRRVYGRVLFQTEKRRWIEVDTDIGRAVTRRWKDGKLVCSR